VSNVADMNYTSPVDSSFDINKALWYNFN